MTTLEQLEQLFKKYDPKGSGTISEDLLRKVLTSLDPSFSKEELDEVCNCVAKKGNMIPYSDFISTVASWAPPCVKALYFDSLQPGFTIETANKHFDKDWNSHPNASSPGVSGPGAKGFVELITAGFKKLVPDFKWKTEECLHVKCYEGDKYIHVGTATGKPVAGFLGVDPPTGKSFHIMAIDAHWVVNGKLRESWHVEEWDAAIKQLMDKSGPAGIPPLHGGQVLRAKEGQQTYPGRHISPVDCPACIRALYFDSLHPGFTAEIAKKYFHEHWNSHPNAARLGSNGPGAKGHVDLIASIVKTIPDFTWKTEALFEIPCVEGMKYVHIGSATGKPVASFQGVNPPTGKSFHMMAIDIHWVVNGLIKESWHVEEWDSAAKQLADKTQLTAQQLEQLQTKYDKNNDKVLSLQEFTGLLTEASQLLGLPVPSTAQIDKIFSDLDKDKSKSVSFQELNAAQATLQKQIQAAGPQALTAQQLDQLQKKYDKNNDKKLSMQEFKDIVTEASQLLGVAVPSELQMQAIFNDIDTDKSGMIEFAEFDAAQAELQKRIQAAGTGTLTDRQFDELRKKYDVDKDQKLKPAEFSGLLSEASELLGIAAPSNAQMQSIFKEIDKDKSGEISFAEFGASLTELQKQVLSGVPRLHRGQALNARAGQPKITSSCPQCITAFYFFFNAAHQAGRGLSAEQLDQLRVKHDKDKNQQLSQQEFKSLVMDASQMQGTPVPSDTQIQAIFKELDKDKSGEISFKEFDTAQAELLKRIQADEPKALTAQQLEELQKKHDKDKNQQLSLLEFAALVADASQLLGTAVPSDVQIEMIFNSIDKNKSGDVSSAEFDAAQANLQKLAKPGLTIEMAQLIVHDDWNSHPNSTEPGKNGPGARGFFNMITSFFNKTVPDFTWKTEEVFHISCFEGDKFVHVGSATGKPVAGFQGVEPPTGKSFHIMAIDVHWVVDGKIKESWHVEDWAAAIQQLTDKSGPAGIPPLHGGQLLRAKEGQQTHPGRYIPAADCPHCVQALYVDSLQPSFTVETAKKYFHDDWNSHPNPASSGSNGPGAVGFAKVSEGFAKTIPDFTWKTEALFEIPCIIGMKYVHIGSATGKPVAPFLGVNPATGKSFHMIAIDIHWVIDGKMVESWHVEEWDSVAKCLASKSSPAGIPPLHDGQALNAQAGEMKTDKSTEQAAVKIQAIQRGKATREGQKFAIPKKDAK